MLMGDVLSQEMSLCPRAEANRLRAEATAAKKHPKKHPHKAPSKKHPQKSTRHRRSAGGQQHGQRARRECRQPTRSQPRDCFYGLAQAQAPAAS